MITMISHRLLFLFPTAVTGAPPAAAAIMIMIRTSQWNSAMIGPGLGIQLGPTRTWRTPSRRTRTVTVTVTAATTVNVTVTDRPQRSRVRSDAARQCTRWPRQCPSHALRGSGGCGQRRPEPRRHSRQMRPPGCIRMVTRWPRLLSTCPICGVTVDVLGPLLPPA
jgi:hypothetical protein